VRSLKEVREALRLGVKRFADEAGVSTRTVQDTESGKTPRRATAEKYASVLRRYGVDPSEVREVAEGLGVLFTVVPSPVWQTRRAWDLLTEALMRQGYASYLRERLDKAEAEYGEEGRQFRERIEAEQWQEFNE
jgi:transcriptional regulator with XRE-family HTH domain